MSTFTSLLDSVDILAAREGLNDVGWRIIGNIDDAGILQTVKDELDRMATAPDVEVNYGGSEHRVWMAHEKSELIRDFFEFSNSVISRVEDEEHVAHNVLAIRNRTLSNMSAELTQGRWHLDSLRRQLKIFVFLTDVTPDSGCFEMIPGSQRVGFKLEHALKGELVTLQDLLRNDGSRAYSHLREQLIDRIVARGYESKAFTVPKGTIALVDTSSVHRARPCISGERYALTSYYH